MKNVSKMNRLLRPRVVAGATFFGIIAAITTSTTAYTTDRLEGGALASLLQKGGHVIYMRHASTEKDYADQVSADPANCSTQRTLSENGWKEAELVGASFNVLNIPVGAVYSSEYCRAWQTAKIAFGSYQKLAKLNFEPSEEYTPEQVSKMRARVTPMLQRKPEDGTNTVIVGHDDPFEAATGIYPEPQGVAYIVRPTGDGFDIIGYIEPQDWRQIVANAQ
ncbi:MAG: histidine phosphatase family protein [Pseudomonadota bacterium]